MHYSKHRLTASVAYVAACFRTRQPMTIGPNVHWSVISRLHDQAGSTSCYMLAGRASSIFARSCKRGISQKL